MSRFFVLPQQIDGSTIRIEGGDAQHIGKVLRLNVGDNITICDGAGNDYQAEICRIEKNEVLSQIISQTKADTEPQLRVVLYQGIPKASKMDFVIQKAVELGAMEQGDTLIDFLQASNVERLVGKKRSVVKLDAKSAKGKVERWNKIAAEASKQCNRAVIPSVASVAKLDEALSHMQQQELKLVPYEVEEKTGLRDVLEQNPHVSSVGILIGPEGGFDQAEIEKAREAGLLPVRLGRRILRTETAPLAVISALMYAYGEIN